MHFKKLKIRGFKGFADPVELPIREGLSGVVGPNGCGKSNLVEAFGWIMGENRPTVMRGSIEDVIFTGAATRPASAAAEVELEIDNSDGRVSAEFARGNEVVVTRRVERGGVSSFLVDGKDVRRRDVQLLFADTASGARSSALVKQGQINEIINAPPSARSGILEDAAGIGGLHQRRHEAELKLNATSQNLFRINDVIEQLKGRIETVTRQARQAARYRRLGEQLRRAEAILHYLNWKKAEAELADCEAGLTAKTRESARLFQEAAAADKRKSELDSSLPPLRQKSAAANAAVQRLRAESDVIVEKRTGAERTLKNLQDQIAQIEIDIGRETALESEASDRLRQLEDERTKLAGASVGHTGRHAEAESRFKELQSALDDVEAELDSANRVLAGILSRRDMAERAKVQADGALASWKQRQEKAREAVADGEARLAQATIHLKSAEGARLEAEREVEIAETASEESETAWRSVQSELGIAREALSQAEGRVASLTSEKEELSRLLADDDDAGARILDRISVRMGYEAAFGAALGDDLFAPELNGTGDSGWRTLPSYPSDTPLPEGVIPLSEFVTTPGLLKRRMSQTGIVEDGENIDQIQPLLSPGQRIVSRSGDLCRWDGFRIAGSKTPSSASLRFKQRNRIEEVDAALENLQRDAELAQSEHERLKSLTADLLTADEQARGSRRDAEQALSDASRELSVAEADASIADRTLESLKQSSQRILEESRVAEQAVREAEAAVTNVEDAELANAEVVRIRELVANARTEMMEARDRKLELEKEHSSRTARLAALPDEINNWKSRLQSAGDRLGELKERTERNEADAAEVAALPEQLRIRQDELADEIEAAEARRVQADASLSEAEEAVRKAEAEARALGKDASGSLEDKGRAEADERNARTRLQEAIGRTLEEIGLEPAELAARYEIDADQLPEVDEQDAVVRRLRRSREALGAVNLRAEQDIEELTAELEAIDKERLDLDEAVSSLRNTISTLNSDGRKRLLEAFEQVNRNFEALFQDLFGGGRARLELVEGDDPLETGLEILCRPPGKRFSNISLLSGGEQTLTALALIFAFFLANPAPVCVLDEVDAPLDDTNVLKFCNMVTEISRKTGTRFLIVTHHSITMARMDRLFGVTMQEKGVSKLVSVDLGEAVRMAA